jgi:actin-related protein 8
MRACTAHLLPAASVPAPVVQPLEPTATEDEKGQNGRPAEPTAIAEGPASQPESEQTPVPSQVEPALPADTKPLMPTEAATPAFATAPLPIVPNESASPSPTYDIVYEASKVPLDGAIAASISMCGNENKVKAAASSILLIGGSSALKGLGAFLAERQVIPVLLNPCTDQGAAYRHSSARAVFSSPKSRSSHLHVILIPALSAGKARA